MGRRVFGLPGRLIGKECTCQWRRHRREFDPWVRQIPCRRKWQPTLAFFLAWRIPWTEEPGGLQSRGSKRVWHDWAIEHTHTMRKICLYLLACYMLSHFSHTWLFVILWTVARQVPPSMGFSRQESWSGLPGLPSGGSSQSRDQTCISASPALVGGFFTPGATGKPCICL